MIHFKNHDYQMWVKPERIDAYGITYGDSIGNHTECWVMINGERLVVDYTINELKELIGV